MKKYLLKIKEQESAEKDTLLEQEKKFRMVMKFNMYELIIDKINKLRIVN